MQKLQESIKLWSEDLSDKTALVDDELQLNYAQLQDEIEKLKLQLKGKSFGLLLNNCIHWAVFDLTLFFNRQCCIPIPDFFSSQQIFHSIHDAQPDTIITDQAQRIRELNPGIIDEEEIILLNKSFSLFTLHSDRQVIPDNICKVTYTSGSTGTPRGVMLDKQTIEEKVHALVTSTQMKDSDKILSLLPLSTLLENIGGLYAGLFSGATIYVHSPETTGLKGSSQLDSQKLAALITQVQPSGFIIIPQLLGWLVQAIKNGFSLPQTMRFIAVGGAPVSEQLLAMAEKLKIPVYQGYGLSEACSVVSLNNKDNNKPGSVGKMLQSHQLKIADDGEILVKNNLFKGYLHSTEINTNEYYKTGDLGYLDKDHYLFIQGRKKNIINTSFGRNISPEWLEKELEVLPVVAQALIYGHGKAFIIALIVLHESCQESLLKDYLQQLNLNLPDYAQIKDYLLISEKFSLKNRQLTGTGRPVREQIYRDYGNKIQQLYENSL